ncbi:hypothetical protein [Deinococcus sp. 23YEL01]|uniref:hypothetical protein n=1 Tax=Deinococcus sp. 23YEL01 TaxID=2745871 RepID=UPI001E49DB13|nr:hypothetical protein [Deinococcus sp. 23YEL01]MCD0169205.1 hypothetical protein [Deinococcus sp. 23YEL01]
MKLHPTLTVSITGMLVLSACTPVQPGSADYVPLVQESAIAFTRLAPGQTVFVEYRYPRSLFEQDSEFDTYFNDLTFNYSASARVNGNVPDPIRAADWMKFKSAEAPKGVTVSVQKVNVARAVRRTTETGGSVNVQYGDQFRVMYKITAAADAETGVDITTVTFTDGKNDSEISLNLNINK